MRTPTAIATLFLSSIVPSHAQSLPPAEALHDGPRNPVVTVQGRGEVRVPNTLVTVRLGFQAAGPEESAVRDDIARRSQAVSAALEAGNVTRLETTAVNIRPEFSSPSEGGKKPQAPKIIGYTGQVAVSFDAPVDQAGRIISSAMNLGANSVAGMFLHPTDEARRAAEQQAMTLAAHDAENQADALLDALSLKKAGIRAIDATGGHLEPAPMPRGAMAMSPAHAPEFDVQAGESVIAREIIMHVEFISQ